MFEMGERNGLKEEDKKRSSVQCFRLQAAALALENNARMRSMQWSEKRGIPQGG